MNQQRFEFIFTALTEGSPSLPAALQALVSAYEASRPYRELRLRGQQRPGIAAYIVSGALCLLATKHAVCLLDAEQAQAVGLGPTSVQQILFEGEWPAIDRPRGRTAFLGQYPTGSTQPCDREVPEVWAKQQGF